MKNRIAFVGALLVTTAMTILPAQAAETTAELARQIQALRDQLETMQKQLEALQAGEAEARAALAKETAAREDAEKVAREQNLAAGGRNVIESGTVKMIPPAKPQVTESSRHRFAMSSADGAWTIGPTGRVHFDMGVYLNQKPEGATGPGTAADGRLTNGVNARRARVGVAGRANTDFTYALILEAGGATDGAATISEARIGYTGFHNMVLELGYGAQYFMLDESTSSNDIMFMERASAVTIGGSFNAGDPRASMGFRKWGDDWYISGYLTSSSPDVPHALTSRGFGAYQRVGYNIIQNDLQSVHIGASAAQVFDPPNTGPNTPGTFTLRDRPEIRIDPTYVLNTGALGTAANPVTSAQVFGVETAAALGSFFMQGEYLWHRVNRTLGPAVNTGGGYLQASYTVGGRRIYVPASASYSGINPTTPFSPKTGGWGAFEFAARVSYTDLVDNYNSSVLAANQPFMVNGGRQTNVTLGLNWIWNSNMLWKINYIHSEFDKALPITSTIFAPIPAGLTLDVLAARMQFVF